MVQHSLFLNSHVSRDRGKPRAIEAFLSEMVAGRFQKFFFRICHVKPFVVAGRRETQADILSSA